MTPILFFLALGSAGFRPAPIDFPPIRIEGGITKVGHQADCVDLSTRFPWRPLRRPAYGQGWIALASGSAKPGRFWVQDTAAITYPGENPRYPAGWIVNVTKWQGVKGWLDAPFPGEIRGEARLVAAPILHDINLAKGQGPISISLVDGFRLSNWTVEEGWTVQRAIAVLGCRNGVLSDCTVYAASAWGPGQGYGCSLQSSTSVQVHFLTAVSVRHAGNVFGGSNVGFYNCRSIYPKADGFETHGFGARKVRFQDCDWGGSNASVGNKYPWGDRDVVLERASGGKTLYCYGATSTTVLGSVFSGPLVVYANQAGAPESVTVEGSTFTKIQFEGEGASRTRVTVQR